MKLTKIFVLLLMCVFSSQAVLAEETFKSPFGIGVKNDGSFYVAEIKGKRISKFDAEGNYTGVITNIKGYGPLKGPFDVDVEKSGNIYIADTLGNSVLVLDSKENLLLRIGGPEKTAAPGGFHEPHYLVANEDLQLIYVADTHNCRVQIFDMIGKLLQVLGGAGRHSPGSFMFCNGVACDPEGNVYAMSWSAGVVNIYNPQWEFTGTFGQRGSKPGQFVDPYSTIWHDNTFWVADTYNNRLQQFSSDWQILQIIGGKEGTGTNEFSHPTDIAFDEPGNIYVADWQNDRILKLDPKGKFIRQWGARRDNLGYKPPQKFNQQGPITLGTWSAPDKKTVDISAANGSEWIYYSIGGRAEDWPISKSSIDYANEKGVKVSAYVAIYHMGPEHPHWTRHYPKYYMKKKGASAPTKMGLSYFYPEIRKWKVDHIVKEIKRIGLNGITLDYIRYPDNIHGYEDDMVEAFTKETGKNPYELPVDDLAWLKFRAKYITLFISELRYELAQLDRPVVLSCYVGVNADDSLRNVMQDWRSWARMGIVDKINQGVYTRDFQTIYDAVRNGRQVCPDRTSIAPVLAAWGGHLNTPELLKKGADVAFAAGADEISVYRSEYIYNLNLWPTIGKIAQQYKNK